VDYDTGAKITGLHWKQRLSPKEVNMRKVRLGKTGLIVTQLGFGGIPIQRLNEKDAIAVITKCLDLGINFIDTANAYSTSEERIGKAIAGRKEGLVLATKSTSRSREGIIKHLDQSLKMLGADCIDLYQFHNVSDAGSLQLVLDPAGPRAALEEAKKAGKIRHIGVTCHQIDTAKKAVASDQFETVMFPFNFVTSDAIDELIPIARSHDVGFISMKPLAGGMISNARIAFKYLFQFPDIVSIPGIEKVEEIEEIAALFQGQPQLTAGEREEMDRLKQQLGTRFCHRCDYCQPCKEGIAISTVMIFPSLAARLPDHQIYSGFWGSLVEKAAGCSLCGECEERCPYHLPIREMLDEHVQSYLKRKKAFLEAHPTA
jgi:predicted aldo/keto reductase-like oxidoreductase